MRVVLDTNILISMAFGGQVGKINAAWKANKFTLVVSDEIAWEYLDVLQRPKLRLDAATITDFVGRIQRKAEFVTPTETVHAVEADPTDNKFLEAALESKAIYVVSGDSHLLELKAFRGIEILTAREFIERLE
jgi:putative PIN family toxin of toxin-antitoxin system